MRVTVVGQVLSVQMSEMAGINFGRISIQDEKGNRYDLKFDKSSDGEPPAIKDKITVCFEGDSIKRIIWIEKGTLDTLVEDAKQFEVDGKLDDAILVYEKIVKRFPTQTSAWYHKAKLHHQLEQKDKTTECYNKVMEQEPDSRMKDDLDKLLGIRTKKRELADETRRLAERNYRLGKYGEAKTLATQGIQLDPECEVCQKILEGISEYEREHGVTYESERRFFPVFGEQKRRTTAPRDDFESMILASMQQVKFFGSKLDDRVERSLKQVAVKQTKVVAPISEDPFARSAAEYQWNQSVDMRMIQLLPSYLVIRDMETIDPSSLSENDFERIEKQARKQLETDPMNLRLWGLVAACLNYRYLLKDAVDILEKLLETHKDWALGWFMIGAIYFGAGKRKSSRDALDKASTLEPKFEYQKELHAWVIVFSTI